MKKQTIAFLIAGSMALAVCGCESREQDEIPLVVRKETEDMQETQGGTETEVADTISFEALSGYQFTFSSGIGGWGTTLNIRTDGSFFGEYFDGEMGDWSEEHPNGTVYQCNFNGVFAKPVKVNDYTYSLKIMDIYYEKEPKTEEIIDGTLYSYTTPYGLENTEELLLYKPGAPLADLPEGYRSWVGYMELHKTPDTELPYWGLYNEAEQCGFSSYDLAEYVKEVVSIQAETAAELEAAMEDGNITQADYNVNVQQLYSAWDYALNTVWDALECMLDEERMDRLTMEELDWITMKETAVAEAGVDVEGGSMESMVRNLKAAELTKARVYELLEMLE